jgi:hypothetical protein
VLKVHRVVQRCNGAVRVDVYVTGSAVERILERFSTSRPKWRARLHCPWSERRRQVAARVQQPPPQQQQQHGERPAPAGSRGYHVATWNVCGISRDQDEVMEFLSRRRVAIAALQETRRSGKSYPLHLRGMATFESPASLVTGALGVALLVSNELPSLLVSSGPHHQWIRVSALLPDRPVYVCNVYCKKGVDVLSAVGVEAAGFLHEGAEVLVLGDFNRSATSAVRHLNRRGFAGSAVRVSSGSSGTFHGRGRLN